MRRFIITILVLAMLGGGGYWFYLRQNANAAAAQSAATTAEQTAVEPATLSEDENVVEATGRLVPAQYQDLTFRAGGIVAEVLVEEGQAVQPGDVLARLRDEQQMKLAITQARLDVLNLEKALADLDEAAPLQAAQAFYDMTMVEKEMEKVGKRRTALNYPRATQEEIDDAYETYTKAEDNFKQAKDFFKADDDAYKGAKAARDNALSAYNWLISKYSDLDRKEVEANYLLLKQRKAELERMYNIYSLGPDPEEVALAEARLNLAKEQLAAAESAYEDMTLEAPFAGVIAQMDLVAGQVVGASQPVLTLADLSGWRVETEDLTELVVAQIQPGDAAEVGFDALSGETFTGQVAEIKPIGETRRGDITYTVVIELAKSDPRLRWNMTSPVSIFIGEP